MNVRLVIITCKRYFKTTINNWDKEYMMGRKKTYKLSLMYIQCMRLVNKALINIFIEFTTHPHIRSTYIIRIYLLSSHGPGIPPTAKNTHAMINYTYHFNFLIDKLPSKYQSTWEKRILWFPLVPFDVAFRLLRTDVACSLKHTLTTCGGVEKSILAEHKLLNGVSLYTINSQTFLSCM